MICMLMLLTQFAFAIEEAEVPAGAETAKETAAESEKAAPEEVKEEPAKEEAKPAAEAPKEEAKAEEEKKEDSAKEETKAEKKEPAKEETKAEQKKEEKKDSKPSFSDEAIINGVKVSVKAAEGIFPEGAKLSVEKVSKDNQKKVDKAVDEAREDNLNVAAVYSFDVKVLDKNGKEIQPADKKKVDISFKLDEADDANLDATIYHLEDTKRGLKAEELKTKTDKDVVSAETDGFSYYTVEFTYNDLQYVMDGDSSVALADILKTLGLEGEVTDVKVSNADLFSAEKKDDKWMVTAHQAFTSTEWMKVTIDGIEYEIVVTDAIPDDNVTSEVEMKAGESKDGSFTIGNGGVVLGPKNGMATIKNGTVTNTAKNSRKGGYSSTNGSAFIAQGANSLQFNDVTINSGSNILVFNIWDNSSITAVNTTLSGSANSSTDVPFLMIGGYPNGSNGTLNFEGTSAINGAKGSIIGGNGGSVINVNSGTLTLTGSEITLKKGNHFVVKSGATLILDGTTLAAADSSAKPAITVEDGGKLILNNVTLEANNNITIQSGGEASLKGTITPKGKQQILVYGTLNLQDTTADLSGNGAIRWIRIEDGGTVNITNSKLSGSTSLGVIRANVGSTLNIENSTFENNKANGSAEQVNGGVILAWDSAITIKDSTFAENSAASGGGVIWMSGGTLDVSGSTFTDNRANGHGGVIYQSGGAVTVTSSKFDGNIADDGWYAHGGAICTMGDKATLTVDDGTFTNNKSLLGSAIIILNGATGHINSALFEGNEIEKSGAYVNDGGTVFVSDGSRLVMPSVSIHNNTAAKGGSGLYVCGVGTANIMAGAAAIYDNENGDVMQRHYPGSKTRIFDEALGGGQHNWTWDTSGDGHNILYANSALTSKPEEEVPTKRRLMKAANTGGTGDKPAVVLKNNKSVGFGAGLGANGTVDIGDRTQIRIYKVWDDRKNAAGKRLIDDDFVAKLTVKNKDGEKVDLSADGIEVKVHKSGEFDAFTEVVEAAKAGRTDKVTASEDNWVIDITGLSEEGWPYTVYESASGRPGEAVSDYYLPPASTDPGTDIKVGFTGFKNTYAEGKATLEGTKTLVGRDLKEGEFEFILWNEKDEEIGRASCDADGKFTFDDITYTLKDYQTAKEYTYYITEVQGEDESVDYDTHKEEVSVKLTYTYGSTEINTEVIYKDEKKPEFVNEVKPSVKVTKVWDDKDDDAALRPESVDIKLLADGKDTGKVLTLGKDNNWKGEFTDLVKYDGDKEIKYSVEEVIEGNLQYYTVSVSGDAESGFTVTNKLEVLTEKESTGTKNWVGDEEGDRPESITIQLLENGTPLEDVILEITPDENGEWTYRFDGMPKYRNGEEIEYSVKELNVPEGYIDEADGFNLTNTYTGRKPETSFDFKFKKKWDDKDDEDGIRPEKVTVRLMRNDEFTGDVLTLTEEDNWEGSFEDLPIADSDGKKYTYGFAEDEVRGYHLDKVESEGEYNVLVNKHEVSKKVKGAKTGDDTHAMNLLILLAACTAVLTAISIRRRKEQ